MSDAMGLTRIQVRPMTAYIGADIEGVDLGSTLDDTSVAQIRAVLLRWKVIFFRRQSIGHREHVAFARRFGTVTPAHPHEDNPPEGFPEILPLDTRRYEAAFGRKWATFDNGWHTDVTALVNPPAASILRADRVPPYGGDTVWTNLVAAYTGLPEPLRELAEKLRATHSFGRSRATGGTYADRNRENPLVAVHPVVRVHPETGERALFVSPSFTLPDKEIIGLSPQQSQDILQLFHREITRFEYTVRFRWEPGSVAFWDNRATAHLAPNDLNDLDFEFDRVLYRVTLEGDVPVGVDGAPSELIAGMPYRGSQAVEPPPVRSSPR
ncbi:TauD/TfdA dioxygenase family protein [Candidatus Protofrankia californiensis]|uniref:TauD/TfdA dioxygenase family protein n=1 Tax=Candidatus Protofrankia californiensis TaxID=1839754 RepID=UPI0010410CA3|nr:TauD/TfdA family dioxygenase [Candidatus Protofrankia californiensis]